MYEEQGEHDRQGDVAGVQPGGIATPGDRPGFASRLCPPGYIWLGDLAGWEVAGTVAGGGQVSLHHRCGWNETLRASGICADFSVYVGNLVERVLELVENHVCTPRMPSPEHQDRVQRWTDSASGGARPVVDREGGPQAGLLTNGPMTSVDLDTEGQRLFRQGKHAEAEIPLAREILGDEAAEQLAARIECPERCVIPQGVTLVEVPTPRHAWGDVYNCPNDGCDRSFMARAGDPEGDV